MDLLGSILGTMTGPPKASAAVSFKSILCLVQAAIIVLILHPFVKCGSGKMKSQSKPKSNDNMK